MSRRHALVVGIDEYPGFDAESQLLGAARDAEVMAEILISHYGFAAADVRMLRDAEATRARLLGALDNLARRAGRGDHVVFYFSGKGSQMRDREGDEGDGLDETLVAHDSGRGAAENRDVSDDEINHWAARVLEKTLHLTLVFDCCHSATLQRPRWRVRSVPPDLRPISELPPSPIPVVRDVETGPKPVVLAACGDHEHAYELPAGAAGEDRGAFSLHLAEELRAASGGETWRGLFQRAARAVRRDCPEQHPQLSGDRLDAPLFGVAPALLRSGDAPAAFRGIEPGRRLLGMASRPDPYGFHLTLFRSRGGAWLAARDAVFRAGDRLRVDLRHTHPRGLYVALLDLGLTGRLTLLFPDHEGREILDPSRTLTVGARRGDALKMILPDDLPTSQHEGTGHILLVASPTPLLTHRLLAGDLDPAASASGVAHPYRLRRTSR